MVTEIKKILLGHKSCQMVERNQCFGNHFCPYHQGSDPCW